MKLEDVFKGKVVIVGIGNTMKGDDGFGPALVERLSPKVKAVCIDAGSAPENYTGKIVKEKPDTILIVDALHLGLANAKGRTALLSAGSRKGEIALCFVSGRTNTSFSSRKQKLALIPKIKDNQ